MRSAQVDLFHWAPLTLIVAAGMVLSSLVAACLGLLAGGRLVLTRSVLVHANRDHAWQAVRDVPALHLRHGKGREYRVIRDWSLRHGDGRTQGSIWQARGTWRDAPYWAEIEILRADPGRELSFRLRGDSLRTHRGLVNHVGSMTLEPAGPEATKITWRLRARLHSPRLLFARACFSPRLRARLFDHGLRSLKVEIEKAAGLDEDAVQAPAGGPGVLARSPTPPGARTPPQATV
jgi:hypothetical protein